jgi:hypothetical protein
MARTNDMGASSREVLVPGEDSGLGGEGQGCEEGAANSNVVPAQAGTHNHTCSSPGALTPQPS